MARSAAATREHVLAVASELFYWNGIRATGIDRVAAKAAWRPPLCTAYSRPRTT